jgi:hypothetical protein
MRQAECFMRDVGCDSGVTLMCKGRMFPKISNLIKVFAGKGLMSRGKAVSQTMVAIILCC